MARILGIDPSLTGTGLAVLDTAGQRPTWSFRGRVKTTLKGHDRLDLILRTVKAVMVGRRPDLIIMESPALHGVAARGHQLAGLWHLVDHEVWLNNENQATVGYVNPIHRAGYATGNIRAKKEAVIAAMQGAYPEIETTDDNIADAMTLAMMGAEHLHLIKTQYTEFVEKITWAA